MLLQPKPGTQLGPLAQPGRLGGRSGRPPHGRHVQPVRSKRATRDKQAEGIKPEVVLKRPADVAGTAEDTEVVPVEVAQPSTDATPVQVGWHCRLLCASETPQSMAT